ncbi:MAG: STAS domain-containing protein [SAR324 cluster bacterium]|nr:STAS domain-containing protein [SAR324 cluster bacterium]
MLISYDIADKICTVSIQGSLNMQFTGKLRSYLTRLIKEETFQGLLIDLKEVDIMDSTGLAVIILLRKELKEENIKFVLCQPNAAVTLAAQRIGLDELVKIYDTQADALASFQHKG